MSYERDRLGYSPVLGTVEIGGVNAHVLGIEHFALNRQ